MLGYSPAQITAWLATKRHERLGWRGETIYLVMTRAQRQIIAAASHRSIAPEALTGGMTAVWTRRVVKRRPPAWLARKRLALARIAIEPEYFATLFDPPRDGMSTQLAPTMAAALDAALVSNIQFLDGREFAHT